MERIARDGERVEPIGIDQQAFLDDYGLAADRKAVIESLGVIQVERRKDLPEVAFEEASLRLDIDGVDELAVAHVKARVFADILHFLVQRSHFIHEPFRSGQVYLVNRSSRSTISARSVVELLLKYWAATRLSPKH